MSPLAEGNAVAYAKHDSEAQAVAAHITDPETREMFAATLRVVPTESLRQKARPNYVLKRTVREELSCEYVSGPHGRLKLRREIFFYIRVLTAV